MLDTTTDRRAREENQRLYRALARIFKLVDGIVRRCLKESRRDPAQLSRGENPSIHARTTMEVSDYRRMVDLMDQVKNGSPEAEEGLREFFTEHPDVYRLVGDFTDNVEELLLRVVMRDSALGRVATQFGLEQLRFELNREAAPPLEKLLIDQVRLSHVDVSIARFASTRAGENQSEIQFWQRQIDRAQKRLNLAISTLVELRERIHRCA